MDKNIDCEDAVLDLIKNNPCGVYQNALWKDMNIDSRKCSRIVKKLLDGGLITRENVVIAGSRTYLLRAVGVEKENNFELLVAGNVFSPCTGCFGNCMPEECPALTYWIMSLSERPEELTGCYGFTKMPDILPAPDYDELEDAAYPGRFSDEESDDYYDDDGEWDGED